MSEMTKGKSVSIYTAPPNNLCNRTCITSILETPCVVSDTFHKNKFSTCVSRFINTFYLSTSHLMRGRGIGHW